MNKERLAEMNKLKNIINSLDDSADADDFHKFVDTCQINYEEGVFNEILRFMQSQAELIQELEREIEKKKKIIEHYGGTIKGAAVVNGIATDEIKALREQNKLYREELDILGEVINSAPNADKLNEDFNRLKGLEESQ